MKKILIEINKASETGSTILLSDLKQKYKDLFVYAPRSSVVLASYNGHTNVLNWFKTNYTDQNLYTHYAIEMSSCNGQTKILDWFKKYYSGEFTDIKCSIILACHNVHLNALTLFYSNMTKGIAKNMDFSCAI